MSLYESVRDDFENLFLKEQGELIEVTRGNTIFTTLGLFDNNTVDFKYDEDIQVGDVLFLTVRNKKATVIDIEYEVLEGQRTLLKATLQPTRI